jgi:hypothetical protein
MAYTKIYTEVKEAYKSLGDGSALHDIEGFSNLLYGLAEEAENEALDEEITDDEAADLDTLAEHIRDAASAVSEMADNFTEAYTALMNAVDKS